MTTLPLQDGDEVLIRSFDNALIQAMKEGGIKKVDKINDKCKFQLCKKGKAKWAILNFKGNYLSISQDGDPLFTSKIPLSTETFSFDGLSPQAVTIQYENPSASKSDFYYLSLTNDFKFVLTKNQNEQSAIFKFEVL
ncbi:hypothetical protein TVAG_172510 [Trichomonas vaginalis G3]|uniref:Uncharacterized protein n=1 Tax=Trichomonas vaginalis (strain ATCC PRA-98 / G3) TaxID=412133 RepID=A2DF02_TRIV3|nr:actin-crosslinking proteins family [Trichomonas vaginalis G3]EAY20994.1 hypothetical protein TVAG_172510 [Trichomonas vaginalis G3]KAI5519165.1 actin-crosslinking proteins family [Trichomonas vaginalis G3]|eukprot:XP_001581980.1 hypothetical protein [Trichomonas vaginalis G3]